MCGIICYSGLRDAPEIVIEGLKNLEYRGYDSWGIGVHNTPSIAIHRQVGKISDFKDFSSIPKGTVAIGHTRWATHGAVTTSNAHPHATRTRHIALVHNGIIENFQELKELLSHHTFSSDTDTEIVAHLIEDNRSAGLEFEEAFRQAMSVLKGRFAIVAISAESDKMLAAKKGSPLVVGIGSDEHFIASDIMAFSDHTKEVVYLEDGDVAVVRGDSLRFTDLAGNAVFRRRSQVDWDPAHAELSDYEHFMIKEILEQKKTIAAALGQPDGAVDKFVKVINSSSSAFIVGCGTAGKVGLVGSYLFSKIAGRQVNAVIGSEFPNYHHLLDENSVLIAISQSGETADTLEAIEYARRKGCKVLSVVNVEGSAIARMSDETILCMSGPEKAVCSTKVTTAQIAILALIAHACAGRHDKGMQLLESVAGKVKDMLDDNYLNKIKVLAKKVFKHESMYLIGRSLNYPVALEAAIKMQEVPYIHAEGFAGGELKHGPIALIQDGVPCIALVAEDDAKQDTIINALAIKSRGGYIIGISPKNNDVFDFWVPVPDAGMASPIVNIIPVQLLSYYCALEKGCDPDKPRNLAKSVTVK